MSDTTENTNELDSYGVWVKNTKEEGNAEDDLNFADTLDLPDFEETVNIEDGDFADMFKEDDTINLDPSADDTTLTDDELMNITSGDGIQLEETAVDDSQNDVDFNSDINDSFDTDDSSLDNISFDSLEENTVTDADLSEFGAVTTEEPDFAEAETTETEPVEEQSFDEVIDDTPVEEMDIEDFGVDSTNNGDAAEEEISLDDFMDSGFSDESVASGNNGFASDSTPAASDSEEVSLDDFVDMSEFGIQEEAPKKEEAIVDEKPLDMDISFDSSADTVETEENTSADIVEEDYEEDVELPTETTTETFEASSTGDNIESEEVDLSDFGIDADAEETPVTQDVEDAKNKETVVDYDLSVGDGNMNAAPVVNEIKSNVEEISEVDELTEEPAAPAATSAPVDNSLLQQIVADLSNLKEEINTLKNNLEEMKSAPAPHNDDSQGIISEEIAIDDAAEDDSAKEDTGFFSGDDGDDTIALSTDELSNILNTADFSEEESAEPAAEEPAAEEPVVEEPEDEKPSQDLSLSLFDF